MRSSLLAADLFCGAGGTTTGAQRSGRVDVRLAVNHWRVAVNSHRQNHPDVRHICAEIDHVDPRDFLDMGIKVVLASPECVFHSNARGGKPVDDQRRATAWCVPRWAETLRPNWLIIENVREFQDWGPLGVDNKPLKSKKGEIFQAWIGALRALNYHVEWRLLNAADYGGATKRVRLFVVARRGASKQPIPWPVPTHTKEQWTPAWSIIDWSLPCPSIFGRKRPLAEKTLRRIEIGLRKFCGPQAQPFIVKMRGTNNAADVEQPLPTLTAGGTHLGLAQPFILHAQGPGYGDDSFSGVRSANDPMSTIIGRPVHGLVTPFMLQYHNGPDGANRSSDARDPLPVVDTNPRHAIVAPFLIDVHNRRRDDNTSGCDKPLPTIVTKPGNSLVVPYLVDVNHGESNGSPGGRVHGVDVPLGSVTTHHGKGFVQAFLTKFNGTGKAESIDEPLSTLTTLPRHGLTLIQTMQELGIVDIGFRMLTVPELAMAQGFGRDYYLHGTAAEQIRQIGNSVHTHVAEALCRAIGEAA